MPPRRRPRPSARASLDFRDGLNYSVEENERGRRSGHGARPRGRLPQGSRPCRRSAGHGLPNLDSSQRGGACNTHCGQQLPRATEGGPPCPPGHTRRPGLPRANPDDTEVVPPARRTTVGVGTDGGPGSVPATRCRGSASASEHTEATKGLRCRGLPPHVRLGGVGSDGSRSAA